MHSPSSKYKKTQNFLLTQREPGRRGNMGPVVKALAEKEEMKAKSMQEDQKCCDKAKAEAENCNLVVLDSSSDGEGAGESGDASCSQPATARRKKHKIAF